MTGAGNSALYLRTDHAVNDLSPRDSDGSARDRKDYAGESRQSSSGFLKLAQ